MVLVVVVRLQTGQPLPLQEVEGEVEQTFNNKIEI